MCAVVATERPGFSPGASLSGPRGYLRGMGIGTVNKPLVLGGVLLYSLIVGALRALEVIGTRGTVALLAVMVADLAATHWLLRRRARRP